MQSGQEGRETQTCPTHRGIGSIGREQARRTRLAFKLNRVRHQLRGDVVARAARGGLLQKGSHRSGMRGLISQPARARDDDRAAPADLGAVA